MCEHGTVWRNYRKNLNKELFCAITKAYWLEDWILAKMAHLQIRVILFKTF